MNIMPAIANLFPQRSRPVRCKSRWRKTLDRRALRSEIPGKILKADRRQPFVTMMYFPRNDEERREIEDRNTLMMAVFGAITGPAMFQPGKLEELAEAAGEGR